MAIWLRSAFVNDPEQAVRLSLYIGQYVVCLANHRTTGILSTVDADHKFVHHTDIRGYSAASAKKAPA